MVSDTESLFQMMKSCQTKIMVTVQYIYLLKTAGLYIVRGEFYGVQIMSQ